MTKNVFLSTLIIYTLSCSGRYWEANIDTKWIFR